MAFMYISEYAGLAATSSGDAAVDVMPEPPVAIQQIAIVVATSTQSAPFNAATRFIEIEVDQICSFAIGTNPTAATTNMRLNANERLKRGVSPGQKIANIPNV